MTVTPDGGPGKVYTTFQFDPTNPLHEGARLGFLAMAEALEIPHNEVHPGERLSADYLRQTSAALYGTDLYGQNAEVALTVLQGAKPNTPALDRASDLRAFLLDRNYGSHQLRGSLGKTMNTLLAGVGLQHPEIEEVGTDWMDMAELEHTISTTYAYDAIRNFQDNVDTVLQEQLRTGRATFHGELLVDGRLFEQEVSMKDRKLTCERVGRVSLGVIAGAYKRKNSSVVAKWLEAMAGRHD